MGGKTLKNSVAACAALIALSLPAAQPAHAVSITYSVANESGSTWVYSYTVANDSLASGLNEFSIFFAPDTFADLEVAASPADWDSLVVEPDTELPDDGFFDSLLLSGTLGLGSSADGFQVRFTWLGAGTPGAQSFSVLDPETFESLFDGRTTLDGVEPPPNGVPEPGSLGLLLTTVVCLGYMSRVRRSAAMASKTTTCGPAGHPSRHGDNRGRRPVTSILASSLLVELLTTGRQL